MADDQGCSIAATSALPYPSITAAQVSFQKQDRLRWKQFRHFTAVSRQGRLGTNGQIYPFSIARGPLLLPEALARQLPTGSPPPRLPARQTAHEQTENQYRTGPPASSSSPHLGLAAPTTQPPGPAPVPALDVGRTKRPAASPHLL